MQRKHYLILVAAVTLLVGVGAAGVGYKLWQRNQNRLKPPPASLLTAPKLEIGELPSLPSASVLADVPDVTVSEVARELRIVWSLRWSPDGRLFITERRGRLLVLKPGAATPEVYARLSTALGGESGLMGLALHPDFPRQPFIYVMYTARKSGGGVNRVSRLRDTPAGGEDETVLIDDIPASRNHDGGVLEFGPDGMLYIRVRAMPMCLVSRRSSTSRTARSYGYALMEASRRTIHFRIPPCGRMGSATSAASRSTRRVASSGRHRMVLRRSSPKNPSTWIPSTSSAERCESRVAVASRRECRSGVCFSDHFLQGPGDTPRRPSLPYGNVRTVGGQLVHDRPAQSGADAISRRWTGHNHQRRAVVAEPIRPFARGDARFRWKHLRRHEQRRWPSRRELSAVFGFYRLAPAGAVGRLRDTRS